VTDIDLSNQDIFAYALYRLQGAGRFVDVEDVYEECWRLSESRFGWRKHKYPNYKVASKAQRDFEEAHPGLVLKTRDGLGRQLSAEGVVWVRTRLTEFERLASGDTRAPAIRRASHRVIRELLTNRLVGSFLAGKRPELGRVEVADILHSAPDSSSVAWRQRLLTLRAAAEDDERPDLIGFLDYIQSEHPEWFDGGKK